MDRPGLLKAGMQRVDLFHQAIDIRNGGAKLGKREQTGAEAVVDVVSIVSDIISDRSCLRLEARMEA